MDAEQFIVAVPAPCMSMDAELIEGAPYYIFTFNTEDERRCFIDDVKLETGLSAVIVTQKLLKYNIVYT